MATLLDKYIADKNSFYDRMKIAMPGFIQVLQQQELLYRIEVLETCQVFVKSAPKSTDAKTLAWHYQLLNNYIQNLTLERRFGVDADDNQIKQRETARNNLNIVIQDYRRRFTSFAPGNDNDCYQKTIEKVIQTVLPVWIQYRQTYIEIKKEVA